MGHVKRVKLKGKQESVLSRAKVVATLGFGLLGVAGAAGEEQPRAHGVAGDPPPPEASDRVLTCEGLFGPKTTHAKLTEAFGPGNVIYDKQDGAEGETYMATVLFPKKAVKRLIVSWADEKRQTKPESITAKTLSPKNVSAWRLPNGIHAGSTLEEVEAVNGKPFALSGFEWDYGGFVADWKGGSMAKALGPCTVTVRFNPAPNAKTEKVSGEATFSSADPKMRGAKPFVSVLTLTRK